MSSAKSSANSISKSGNSRIQNRSVEGEAEALSTTLISDPDADIKAREARAMDLYNYATDKSSLNIRALDKTGERTSHENILQKLRKETEETYPHGHHMMLGPLEASLLEILVKVSGAARILDLGTFTGYSALSMLRGLSETKDSCIITVERNPMARKIAEKYTKLHPRGSKIKFLPGDALEILRSISNAKTFDMIFVDAHKKSYVEYLECILKRKLVKVGGLIIFDNVLFRGMVAEIEKLEEPDDASLTPNEKKRKMRLQEIAKALDEFNRVLSKERRLESVLLPIRDGITIARRKI